MATLLMNLRHVPDDEADEVRTLLRAHGIDFYETPPNRWGVTMGAIWLRDDNQADEARRLLAQYQQDRQARARAEYEHRRRTGDLDTFWALLLRDPVRVLVYLVTAAAVLLLVSLPFFQLAR